MRQINDQQYEQFTPEERTKLAFAALARNDETEANRLWATCPKYHYKVHDLNFTERFNALILIGSVFFQKSVHYYILIKRLDEFISDYHRDLEYEEQAGLNDREKQTQKLLEQTENTRTLGVGRLKSLYKGFERFCNKAGVGYNDILKSLLLEEVCQGIGWIIDNTVTEVADTDISLDYEMFLSYWNFS